MDVIAFLVTDSQPTLQEELGEDSLDDVAVFSKPAYPGGCISWRSSE